MPDKPNPIDDPARLAALAATGLADSAAEEAFDRLTRMVTRLLGVPVSLVSLVDDRRQFFKSIEDPKQLAGGQRETPHSHSFCKTVVVEQAPLIVSDAENDPRVSDNLAIPDLGVKAYLGVPLVVSGHVIGSLCAIDTKPRTWSDENFTTLSDIAQIVMSEIELRQEIARRAIAESNQELLIAELNHRVKNTLATVQALIQLSIAAAPSLQQFRETIGVRIASLAKTHTLLKRQQWRAIGFRSLLDSELAPYEDGRISLNGPDFDLDAEIATTLGMVIHELTTNSAKYGALSVTEGKVAIEWKLTDNADRDDMNIEFTWRETDGPPIQAEQNRTGFGTTLIERLIEKQFGGTTHFDFARDGIKFHTNMPAPRTRAPDENPAAQAFNLTKR